jgi:hypothetical protein
MKIFGKKKGREDNGNRYKYAYISIETRYIRNVAYI